MPEVLTICVGCNKEVVVPNRRYTHCSECSRQKHKEKYEKYREKIQQQNEQKIIEEKSIEIQCSQCKNIVSVKNKQIKICKECAEQNVKDKYKNRLENAGKQIEIECFQCGNKVIVKSRLTKLCPKCSRQNQLDRCKNYKKNNRERVSEYNKIYKSENKQEISEYNKTYNIEKGEQMRERHSKQQKERAKYDEKFRIKRQVINMFKKFFKRKTECKDEKILDLVGCNNIEYKKWIEYNFIGDMSWENYGKVWHIDHVLLCNLFDLRIYEHQKIFINWQNTRPLFALENLSRKTFDVKELLHHELIVNHYIKNVIKKDTQKLNFGYLFTKLSEKSDDGHS